MALNSSQLAAPDSDPLEKTAFDEQTTLRAGDLFVYDAGSSEVAIAPGSHAELVVESPWAGALAHTAHRSG